MIQFRNYIEYISSFLLNHLTNRFPFCFHCYASYHILVTIRVYTIFIFISIQFNSTEFNSVRIIQLIFFAFLAQNPLDVFHSEGGEGCPHKSTSTHGSTVYRYGYTGK